MPGVSLQLFLSLDPQVCDPLAQATLPIVHVAGLNVDWKTRHGSVSTEQVETVHLPVALPAKLLAFRPQLIIAGEFGPRSLVALAAARLLGVPLVLWSEEIAETALSITRLQRLLRGVLLPRAAAFLAWGEPARWYLQSQGIDDARLFECAQAVDNEQWQSLAETVDREAERDRAGMRGRVFLAVGRLVERKGFANLLDAWSMLPADLRRRHTLILVGDGPERLRLQHLAAGITGADIRFMGRLEGRALAACYALADVFVFPSLVDVWGLVVNEAMACGLPVLGSRFAGASQQLVTERDIGELFDPTRLDEFACLLGRWSEMPQLPTRERPRQVVAAVNFETTQDALERLLARVMPVRR
jgi:glycosyltransferase involved in cell wall biosynthesis